MSAQQEKIDFGLRETQFYKLCREVGIFSDFPEMNGAHFIPPYGAGILNGLESVFFEGLYKIGYTVSNLPPILPEAMIQHLNPKGLCHVEKGGLLGNVNFYCAPDTEPLAAYLAMNELTSGRNLPKIVTINDLVRDESRHPLVKELGYKGVGINGFFSEKEAAVEEANILFALFREGFYSLSVPVIEVVEDFKPEGQKKLYSYFPFSGRWGSLFCVSVPGIKYTSVINDLQSRKPLEENRIPIQLNAGFTQRILGAYLAIHQDPDGFLLEKEISPKQVYIYSTNIPSHSLFQIKAFLNEEGIPFEEDHRVNPKTAYFTYKKSGIPIMIDAGRSQLRLRTRNGTEEWIGEQNKPISEATEGTLALLKKELGSYKPDLKRTLLVRDRLMRQTGLGEDNMSEKTMLDLIMVELTSPLSEYEPDILYFVPDDCSADFINQRLKSIGYNREGTHKVFVRERY